MGVPRPLLSPQVSPHLGLPRYSAAEGSDSAAAVPRAMGPSTGHAGTRCFSVSPGHTHKDRWPELGTSCSVSKSRKDPGSWMWGQQRKVVLSTPAPSLGSHRQRTGGTPKHKTPRYLGCPPQPGGDMYLGSSPKRSRFWCALPEMVSR